MADGDTKPLGEVEFCQWLTPAAALKSVPHLAVNAAKREIAERLRRGLIRSAAETFLWRSVPAQKFVELPTHPWLAWCFDKDDHFWEAGTTQFPWLAEDGEIRAYDSQAFGVRFDGAGLKALSPIGGGEDTSASEWVSTPQALQYVMGAGKETIDAKRVLVRNAAAGLILARCLRLIRYEADILARVVAGTAHVPQDNVVLDPSFWVGVGSDHNGPRGDWATGDFESLQGPIGKQHVFRAHRVVFRKDHVLSIPGATSHVPSLPVRRLDHSAMLYGATRQIALEPQTAAHAQIGPQVAREPTTAPHAVAKSPEPRGAPPKTFFEDALIAVALRWHMGDFKPARQADVQRELERWLDAQDIAAGPTAIKERARKLWNAFKD